MADKKKKGFSLDKGKETKSEGFNISKGDKTTSSFGLDKGSKKVSSKKSVVSKKSDTKKSSVVKDSTKSSSSKDPQKTANQTTNSQNTKSNNSKLYALIGIAAILVVVFLIFSGDDKSTNPSSLSNEVVENSGSNLEGVSGENEMNNNNEMSVDNSNDSNDSGNKSNDSSTVESSDVNTNKESNQSNSSTDNTNNVVADSSDSSEDANNSIDTSNSESNSSVAENSTTTNSQSNNSKQVSFSNNDILYYFQFGSSYINPNDRVLNKLADELKSNNSKIKLVGHTDSTGSEAVNLEISKSRAQAVFSFLVSKGVNRNLISVDGLGESKPLNGNSNAEERSSNRRVEIILN
jgi:outer membrane protein OmpA-like peptidoglycan-associated protein